ncbi:MULTISPECIES: hypothetical protein [unclassified Aureimonas]|uniref:hypothetical protein n=1 Tax=unclassified Aureimonas TaxID=2615206 RepID=UPI000B11979B|nr:MULTISPECIES: hypothetical protein [unclassified Aureimonas]
MRTLSGRAALAAGLIVAGVGQAYADNPSGGFQEQRFGPWRVGVTMSGSNQACVMLQRGTGNSKLAVLRQPRKTAEMALIGPPGSFTENAAVEALVLIDGVKLWSPRVQYVSPQMITFFGFLDRSTGDGRGLLEASQTMTVTFGAFTAELDLRQSAEALQALTDCADGLEADESAKARARANTPPSESEVTETRQDLGTAMRGITGGQPLVAQFQCAITTRDLTGLPDFGGHDPANAVTIGVSEDGSGFINGTTMASAQVERGDGGELIGTHPMKTAAFAWFA